MSISIVFSYFTGINHNKQCCDINLNTTDFGDFRWRLNNCDAKRLFVCQVRACNKNYFRCVDGRKCVSRKRLCDGRMDCEDGSDERQCSHGKDKQLLLLVKVTVNVYSI